MKYLFIFLIRVYIRIKALYIRLFSPNRLPTCRFYPTCSQYALKAFETEKASTALLHTVKRIIKCHPFQPYSIDKN